MYSKTQLALKYLHYYITAASGKGHGIHSPFIFDFITNVLNDKNQYYAYAEIERLRKDLLTDTSSVEVLDLGAGSSQTALNTRRVKDITRWSLKPPKYAQLLFRIANHYQPETLVELGTAMGLTTAYLASANSSKHIYTFEGAPAIARLAQKNIDRLHRRNIQLITGNFDETLEPLLKKINTADFVFIDGNHRQEPTLRYFEYLLPHLHPRSIVVFDDIHWSREMEAAWKTVLGHPSIRCSIDLFFIGIVFFNPDFKEKQQFTIRF